MKRIVAALRRRRIVRLVLSVPLMLVGLLLFSPVRADLPSRSLLLSNNTAGTTALYRLGFTIPATETLGSIKLLFCSNDPLFEDPCTVPSGFDVSSATLTAQAGQTGFVIDSLDTNANTLVLSRVPASANAGSVSYTLSGVVNPDAGGSYYGRLQTFASTDATGAENEHGGLAFTINGAVQISTTVPPYLLFCTGITISGFDCDTASGDYINFGNLASNTTSSADSQFVTATNAESGYSVRVSGSTMTSGNNVIDALAAPDVSRPGTSQFGINLVNNNTPGVGTNPQGPGAAVASNGYNQTDMFKFSSGDVIATTATADEYKKFTTSYIVNIPSGQSPGVYVSTLTYVCLANF